MNGSKPVVSVIPLAKAVHVPVPPTRRTRDAVPAGYGRREQCRPFVEANGVGLAIASPFGWGYCESGDVPAGARAFRSPVARGCPARVFYVRDDPATGFRGNGYAVPESVTARTGPLVIPGLSFFERTDQQGLVKLHLPYVLRTEPGMALLFVPPLNRPRGDGLTLLSGMVETAWYADAVNMVFELPPSLRAVHVAAGEVLAQAIPVPVEAARTSAEIVEPHRKQTRIVLDDMAEWRRHKGADRSAYKRLARAR
jgi:hypothetical protein